MSQENDSFLGEDGVDKHNDGMCKWAAGRQMRMVRKRLWGGSMWPSKSLYKFDEREVADSLGPDDCGNFDRDGDVVVDHFGLEFMCVPR